ncbi:MAG: FKBP-type peptidyl-prolyl cis-trans isomerase [Candidatus Babeliaceae bacterium]|nr:FKBP-type peptidyl-prolyl cis-trans isomerase [Candidatus Babeliaceae bacterium]
MKKIVRFRAPLVILTSMLCAYSSVYADALCCGKKHKQVHTSKNVKNAKVDQEKTRMQTKQKTASGLEYVIIEEGTDNIVPKPGSIVTVHYTGWLKNGNLPEDYTYGKYSDKAFDSSIKRGQKFQFKIGVGQVIKGWDEGVMGMKIGEKRRLYIPASLGYGARGAGSAIPPHADLVFDVELFDVSK